MRCINALAMEATLVKSGQIPDGVPNLDGREIAHVAAGAAITIRSAFWEETGSPRLHTRI